MAAAPRGSGGQELGPPGRDDPGWAVGQRRHGWLKVSEGTFVHGGRWAWVGARALLHLLRFTHLGRRPVLGPPLPVRPGTTPLAHEPVGERRDLRWEPAEGTRARLLRGVPPAALGLTALAAYAGVRRLRRVRMAAGRPGRLAA